MKLSAKAKASLQTVIEKFQNGDLSPIVKVASIKLDPTAPAANWSFGNKVLAYCQSGTLDCRGYKQWQSYGRQVKKGSHASFILSPRTIKKKKDDGETYYQLIGFTPIAVFPANETEGETPLPDYTPTDMPPLMDVAERLGIKVNYTPVSPDRLGDCSVNGNRINLGTDDPAIFFHELGHAAHARVEGLQGGQNPKQETIAEFIAAVLMEMYGLGDRTGNAWRYISNYASDPLTAITKALATIEKVLDVIFEEK